MQLLKISDGHWINPSLVETVNHGANSFGKYVTVFGRGRVLAEIIYPAYEQEKDKADEIADLINKANHEVIDCKGEPPNPELYPPFVTTEKPIF